MPRKNRRYVICIVATAIILSSIVAVFVDAELSSAETKQDLYENSADYLIVLGNSEWEDAIVPYAEFKGSQGRNVRIEVLEGYPYIESSNANYNIISNQLTTWWNEEGQPWPFYILLVGSAEHISPYFDGWANCLGGSGLYYMEWRDHQYWNLNGNQNTYEAMVGRWPVYSEEDIHTITDKTIRYAESAGEWTTDIRVWYMDSEGDDFSNRAQGVVDALDTGNNYTTSMVGFDETFEDRELMSEQFLTEGHSLYFYRGHGRPSRWRGGDFASNDLYHYAGITQTDRYGIMMSISCYTGVLYNISAHDYGSPNTMMHEDVTIRGHTESGAYRNNGEQWVLQEGGGGPAFIGAPKPMYTHVNQHLAVSIANEIASGERNLGTILYNMKMDTEGFPTYPAEGAVWYNILGDPDINIIFNEEEKIGVTVSHPSGGEAWAVGSLQEITWTAEEGTYPIDNVDLLYSTNGGESWTTIAAGIPDTGSHTWTVPDEPSIECMVRVIVRDTENNTGQDTSGLFAIVTDPINVTLSSPNGGEVWDAGVTEWITWTTDEGDNTIIDVDLHYSIDGGDTWYEIVTGIPDTGSHSWEVPNVASDECLVRLSVNDDLGLRYIDESDGYFTIIGVPPSPPTNLAVDHFGEDETLVVFGEDFTGVSSGNIPSGWTRSHTHWGVVDNDEAGGVAPELRYLGSGFTTTTYRCYTPAIDTTGYTELDYSFRHRYVHLSGSITLRAEISTDGSSWSTLWQHTGGSTGPAVVDLTLDTTDGVGSSTLYLAWTFVGRSNDARRWLIDDIALSTEVESDGDEHNLIIWDASIDDPEGITHYNIYRSESYDGPWDTSIAAVDAAGQADYQYIDINRGAADGTLWWYVVRAVGNNGMEDGNTDAVREPGPTETFDIPLTEGGAADGWNFVSFDLIPADTTLEAILSDIDGSYERVMYYDASTGRWLSYMPGRDGRFNDLNTWGHHMGLWIKVNSGATLTVEGMLPTTTEVTLYPGWNMVGLPSRDPGNHGLPSDIDIIGYFEPSEEYNVKYEFRTDTFIFEPGRGYWIHNPNRSPITWRIDY